MLECQKQNATYKTKLQQLETSKFKRPPNTNTVQIIPSTSCTPASSNLAMEDEEGEVFNNTYLADLKSGRMTDYMSKDIW